MKLIGLVMALMSFSCEATKASDPTAVELAQHLGISVWRIPQGKLPKAFTAYLQQVRDGKIITGGESAGFGFTGNGDLVVCAHEENGEMVISLAQNGMVWRPYSDKGLETPAFSVKHEIDSQPAMGEHLLCADYPLQKDAKNPNGMYIATGKVKDAARGLVLIIAPE